MAKTIVFFSTKGGVGKTLLSTNLAVSLANDKDKEILLIDLDVDAPGDMSRMLGVNPTKSLFDLSLILDKPNSRFKKEEFLLNSHNIDFLAGVLRPQESYFLQAEVIRKVIDLFDKDYEFIIVDGGRSFNEILVTLWEKANLLILVLTPDILSIYQTRWIIDTLQTLHFPLKMVRILINRAEAVSSISSQEIKKIVPIEIIGRIPSEGKVVGLAVNQGIPVVIDNPNSKISKAIRKLSEEITSNNSLYIEHKEIEELRLKDKIKTKKSGEFWEKEEFLKDVVLLEEKETNKEEIEDEILHLKKRIHTRLIEELNIKRLDLSVFSDIKKTETLRKKAESLVVNLLIEEAGGLISSVEVRQKLTKEILDEALGYGPLEDLLSDPEITDIMVNNKDEIYVERHGKIELTNKKFISNDQVRVIIERIIAPIGRRIDESVPMVDARLPDGSRVNAIIPPLSLTGPTLTIRKFRKEKLTIEDLIKFNTLNHPMAEFLKACVLTRKNIIVSGGTGSGKTTILNVLSSFIPDQERIITIEDAAELKLTQTHWVRLESRPPNIEGKGAITIRDLFRNTLRMRPDRIIIGECRGVETLDMLQAMNTGHDGSMTTIHANSTRDVLARLDSMILMSGIELPIRAIREMIASAVDIIVHTARLSDGTRKVVQITEITGMKDELHIDLADIFIFKQTGVDERGNILGYFTATGCLPTFFEEMRIKGIKINEDFFRPAL